MTRVKVCGITNERDAWAAIEAGADALGFIAYQKSPRYVNYESIASWLEKLPPFVTRVGVVVNTTLHQLEDWQKRFPIDAWQFHGSESAEFIAQVKGIKKIKAFSMSREFSHAQVRDYEVDAFLLDTPSESYGGSGKTFDWELATKFRDRVETPIILSGGLNAENVARAIEEVQPYAVDVNSGVEFEPGKKDAVKLKEFFRICRDKA
ncbi:MAG: phosphoribosylanthranilate isomerase [Verrucomicrobiae bacterium]|nr:phosphoribosylanthranilate isomerase [Verrucomicrobiae bacterium]